jgi:hypothetical protein
MDFEIGFWKFAPMIDFEMRCGDGFEFGFLHGLLVRRFCLR